MAEVDLFHEDDRNRSDLVRRRRLLQGPVTVRAVGGSDAAFGVDGVDFRELEAQDLIRPTSDEGYELTNIGRIEYEQRKNARDPRF
jgi:hypothetical protein